MKKSELHQIIKEEIQNIINKPSFLRDLKPDTEYEVTFMGVQPNGEKEIDTMVISLTQDEIDKEKNLSIQNYLNGLFVGIDYEVISVKNVKEL